MQDIQWNPRFEQHREDATKTQRKQDLQKEDTTETKDVGESVDFWI